MLLKSEVPADGYEAWRTGAAAGKLVEELHKEQGRYSKIIEQLKADGALGESVRKVALQIARARLWADGNQKKEEAKQ